VVAAAVVLPKCQTVADLKLALDALDACGADIPLIPIIETAAGLEAASSIARAAPHRLARLSLGLGDLSRDLGISWAPEGPMAQHARCHVGIVSRSAGLAAQIDTVVPTIGDVRQLIDDTARARAAGFGGKFCVHPSQVGVVQAGFRPSDAELQLAQRQVLAFIEAIGRGSAAVVVDGYFVDYPVAELAEATLARAGRATGLLPTRDTLPASGDSAPAH
jgi:citrate lyase subunit beta/citryl-CoA lyase